MLTKLSALIAFALGSIVCSTAAIAQPAQWIYKGDNGATGPFRETVTLVITKRPSGYAVSGEYVFPSSMHSTWGSNCMISGTYFPAGRRLRGTCKSDVGKEFDLNGTRRTDRDQFQIQLGSVGNIVLAKCAGACMGNAGNEIATRRAAPKKPASRPGAAHDNLGTRWDEREPSLTAYPGTWTRQGTSNIFHAQWAPGSTATITIQRNGNQIVARRTNDTEQTECTYNGTVQADGVTVIGKVACTIWITHTQRGPIREYPWSATIK